jgi:FkbM family methyltransferase
MLARMEPLRIARWLHLRLARGRRPALTRAEIAALLGRELASRAPWHPREWLELVDAPSALPAWRDRGVRQRIHDPDYVVLGAFTDPATTILDVGANRGYSAWSMWAAGARTAILAFEPHPVLVPQLRALARVRRGDYDFRPIALDAGPATLELATPVVNGVLATALTTADRDPDLDGLARNVEAFAAAFWPRGRCYTLRIRRFTARAAALDTVLATEPFAISVARIVAIKIDTEGLEARVLAGAQATLARHRPLLVIETGRSYATCIELARAIGYRPAQRAGRQLHEGDGVPYGANVFFVHPDQLAEYRRIGLWA